MSVKSILLSLLALVLSVGAIFAVVFLFKSQFILGFVGLLLFIIPLKIQQKAISETNGAIDKVFVKYIVPALLLIAILFIVLYFTLWS